MKLYIATTTLNFDTIMSTESISPVSFYSLRRFGIPYMYDKVSLCLPNSILLLDFIPDFSINRQEYDHRALIIEIDTDFYPNDYFKQVKEGVYQTSKTIYLSPQSSSIIFLNYEDYTVTLNKSANIVETKYGLYQKANRIGVIRQYYTKINGDFFKGIEDIDKIDEESLRRDKLINKAKGFITGYLIGRGKSLTAESARLLNISRQIKNVIYSFVTKEGSDRSRIYQELRSLINEANLLTSGLDNNKAKVLCAINEDLIANGFNDEEIKKVRKYLNAKGLYQTLIGQLCPGTRIFNIEQAVSAAAHATDDQELDRHLKILTDYINSILKYSNEDQDVNSLIKFHPDLKLIECLDNKIDDESRKIIPIIYNLFSDQNIRGEDFKSRRIDHIIEIAKVLQNSSEINFQLIREYINGLLDNLEEAKPFDVKSSELAAINSFGAFIKAPDADIEKLISLLVSNEISDRRIAMGLWGIIYGYSNIPNQYFKQWIIQANETDIHQYLDLLNTQIYGNAFMGQSSQSEPTDGILVGERLAELEQPTDRGTSNKEPSLFDEIEERNAVKAVETSETSTNMEVLIAKISTVVNEILKKHAQNKRKPEEFIQYYMDAIKVVLQSCKTIASIRIGIEGIQVRENTVRAWGKAKKEMLKAVDDIKNSSYEKEATVREPQAAKPSRTSSASLLYDPNLWDNIVNIIPNNSVLKEQFKKDLKWFTNNYEEEYLEKEEWVKGRFYGRDNTNSAILDHLKDHLKGKKNSSQPWLREKYDSLSNDSIDRLIGSLKLKYL